MIGIAITIGCSKDFLEKCYGQVENLRLEILEELYKVQDEMEAWQVSDREDRTNLAKARYDGKILRITVSDIFPHQIKGIKNAPLRTAWTRSIVDAIEDLRKSGCNPRFKKVLCAVTIYHTTKMRWDVDNRAIKYLINGLTCARVIHDDDWKHLALLVIGDQDKDNPRTEIILIPVEQDFQEVLEIPGK